MEPDIVCEKNNVLNVFDEILFKHLERLIGSSYGVGELSVNSVTISLIMLLMERENEIESFPSDEIDRYKNETLIGLDYTYRHSGVFGGIHTVGARISLN